MPLRCEACSNLSDGGAKGWQAIIVEDYESCSFVVSFCPTCASGEFPDADGVSRAEA